MADRDHTVVAERSEDIRTRVEAVQDLPTLPPVLAALREILAEPGISPENIAQLISKDPALSANFLKLVNAPFYGFPGRIASVQHALVLAGPNVARAIASSTPVCATFETLMVGLWEHSLGVALISRLLAERLDIAPADELMVAGLLHDLGKMVLLVALADEAERAYKRAADRGILIAEAERDILDVDHAEIGEWAAKSWNLPETLYEPIAYHHDPLRSNNGAVRAAVVHVADIFVRALDFGNPGDELVPPVRGEAWDLLGLSEEDLRTVVNDVDNELSVTGTTLFRTS